MKSLWEHILLEADKKEPDIYYERPVSIWKGIRYKNIDGANTAKERCIEDPAGLLNSLGIPATETKQTSLTTAAEDLLEIYKGAIEGTMGQIIDAAKLIKSSSDQLGVKLNFKADWKYGYLNKQKKPDERKSMQTCCFWVKSIAVAAFRTNRIVPTGNTVGIKEGEGSLRVEVVASDDVIVVYFSRRVNQWGTGGPEDV